MSIDQEQTREFITTYSGIHFFPTEPRVQDIYIADIAHALSLICRGNGHVKTFFSVGQHCINCALEAKARGYGSRIVLACLLHDAGECYMSDVPRPFKKTLPEYREQESKLLNMIYTKYLGAPLSEEEQIVLSQIDDDMLYYDLKELLSETPEREEPRLFTEISYEVQPFEAVEQRYLQLYYFYQGNVAFEDLRKRAKITSKWEIKAIVEFVRGCYQKAEEAGHPDAGEQMRKFTEVYFGFAVYQQDRNIKELLNQ